MHKKVNFETIKEDIKSNEENKKNIHNLLKEKKYDEIFILYGSKTYRDTVPLKYQKKEIKRLLKEGKFYDIYTKYGESVYEKYLPKMQAIDIYMETNKHKFLFKSKQYLKIKKKVMAMYTAGVLFLVKAPPVLMATTASNLTHENAITYCDEITEYNKKIENYTKEIKKYNLSDFQIVMKVMEDMWASIKGYGEPQKDITGFLRLDLMNEDGVGVCRNMSDDVAAKLNEINPEFNARILYVTMNDGDYYLCNIQRKIVNDSASSSSSNENNDTEENNFVTDVLKNIYVVGNHAVVLFDMPGEDITMIVDPTNPSLGLFKNGEIYMFSTPDGKGYSPAAFSQSLTGFEGLNDYGNTKIASYFTKGDIEVLREKYGIDAENKALEEVHNIVESVNTPKKYSSNNTYHNSFTNEYEYSDSYGKSR